MNVTHFSDPGCPFGWSAEPHLWRMRWRYGDGLGIHTRMIVLARAAEEYLDKGFDTTRQSSSFATLAERYGMPIDAAERPRMAATLPACLAVVAARERAPEHADALLRALRIRHFSGELLDEPSTSRGAAADAGLDAAELERWTMEPEVRDALEADADAARHPTDAALRQDGKLASWEHGRRLTCPSYEFGDERLAAPGFQPVAVYDVLLANALPGVDPRPAPESVEELLAWAGESLATQEVATVCEIDRETARERLAAVAQEQPLGSDALWSL